MDKRYQVFVSSTFEDLQEERKEVMQALLELDCIPAGMELFPASNDDQWTLIKNVIDDSDYYLLIIGGRYGSENQDGISYTQMEFEYALQQGKPIISFLPKDPASIPAGKSESDPSKREKLEKFKDLAKKKLVRFWTSASDLGSVVSRSMVKLIRSCPAEGWVKSNSAVDEESLKEISRLQKENNELKRQLEVMATQPPKGTERLAQGESEIEILFSFEAVDHYLNSRHYNDSRSFTWNQIFKGVAPSMIVECSELHVKARLCQIIDKLLHKNGGFRNVKLRNIQIDESSFDLIKVQFKALGLICLSDKKTSTKNTNIFWKLTPYGEYLMTQLLAVRKDKEE